MAIQNRVVAATITTKTVAKWQQELRSLTADLKKSHGKTWSWTSGGCFAFADAFVKTFGGKKKGVASHDVQSGDFPVEHAFVELNGVKYDYSGVFEPKLKKNQKIVTEEDPEAFWFEDDFLSDAQLKHLTLSLKNAKKGI
jgi:hypothetical protein